jgi:hypothetical protein
VICRAFFYFPPCSHIINIKKYFSFSGEVKDSLIFPPFSYFISFINLYSPLIFPHTYPRELKTFTPPLSSDLHTPLPTHHPFLNPALCEAHTHSLNPPIPQPTFNPSVCSGDDCWMYERFTDTKNLNTLQPMVRSILKKRSVYHYFWQLSIYMARTFPGLLWEARRMVPVRG